MTTVYADERIAYQPLSLFYDTSPARCHAEEDMNKRGNHRASVKHRNFFLLLCSCHILPSGSHL